MTHKPKNRDYEYAVNHVHSICCLAGVPSYLDDLRSDLRDSGVLAAVDNHDTGRLFDWLMSILSFQGIANRVAEDFIYNEAIDVAGLTPEDDLFFFFFFYLLRLYPSSA